MRPEGDQRDDVLDAAGKVLRTDDPEAQDPRAARQGVQGVRRTPTPATRRTSRRGWARRPASGSAGVDRDEPGYVVAVAAKDTEKAQEAIDKGVKDEGGTVKQRSYEDVDYQVDEDGVAAGIVGDFFTVGTEAEFKRTVKANDGDSLADDKSYKDTVDEHRRGPPRALLRRPQAVLRAGDQVRPQARRSSSQQLRSIFPIDKLEPMAGALLADGDRIAFDTLMTRPGREALRVFAPVPRHRRDAAVAELPGDSWAAYGAPNVGPGLKSVFTRLAGALGGAAATQQLQQQYGIDLERDVFGWIGDIAIFVRGSDKASLEGGLVIKATNADNMRGAFGKLVGLIQSQGGQKVAPVKVKGAAAAFKVDATDLGKPVIIARSDDRVVDRRSARRRRPTASRRPRSSATRSSTRRRKAALDDVEPTFLLSMPDLIKAVDASGDTDADWAKAKPYLEAFR